MKIAIIHNKYSYSGGEASVVKFESELLRKFGNKVLLITTNNNSIQKGNLFTKILILLHSHWNRHNAQKILKLVNKFQPDIVHIHNFWYLLTPALHFYLAQAGYPIIQTLHNYRLLCLEAMFLRDCQACELCITGHFYSGLKFRCYKKSLILSFLVRRMIKKGWKKKVWTSKISRYIVLTNFAKSRFIKGGLPSELIDVKDNFVRPLIRREQVNFNNREYILFVGRISVEKGIILLLKAIENIDIECIICGDGPLRAELLKRNQPRVRLVGKVPPSELKIFFNKALVNMLPSISYEGMPMSIIEGYSCGVPCIAANTGGIPEIVINGITGLLFQKGDVNDLRNKINQFLCNPAMVAEMGKNSLNYYYERFTEKVNYYTLEKIYKSVSNKTKQIIANHNK